MTTHRLRNLTPHALDIRDSAGHELHLPPEPSPVRRAERRTDAGTLTTDAGAHVPLQTSAWEAVSGLPSDLRPGEVVIVSALIAEAVAQAVPDGVIVCRPGDPVRDASGRPVACHGLVLVSGSA
jgi:hypothetical protein